MSEDSLKKFVKSQLSYGLTKKEIKNNLLKQGYSKEKIDAAFNKEDKVKEMDNISVDRKVKYNNINEENLNYNLPIIALILSLLPFIPFASIIGIILGIVSLKKISEEPALKGKGFAIAAIVIAGLRLIIAMLLIFLSMGSMFYMSDIF